MSGGTRSYEMARRLVRAGHAVHLISSHREGDFPAGVWREEVIDGIHIHWYGVPYSNRLSYGRRVKAFVRFAWAAAVRAVAIGGDLVFATSTPLTIALPGIYAAKRLRAPMVFEVRDLWPELPVAIGALKNPLLIRLAEYLEKFAYRNSSRVVALSPGMADGVRARGYPPERISVIPNSCDIDLFRVDPGVGRTFRERHPFLGQGPLLVYAGTLGVINWVGYLVDIAAEMKQIEPSVRFLIVGDGREKEAVRRKAEAAGVLQANLWMMEQVPKKEMPALLSAATLAVSLFVNIPEMWNNSANKFFDALAAGRPVVINYRGWQADLLAESGAGLVIAPDRPREAAAGIAEFLRDTGRLHSAGEAAAKLAADRFDRDVLARRLRNLLEEAAAEKER
jgi:glycosyltransferase involved in cell wall biosynthesis